ncbi:hypothetical protein SAMN04487779_10902, partial [Belnapia rosea]
RVPRPLARHPGPSFSQANRAYPPVRNPGTTSPELTSGRGPELPRQLDQGFWGRLLIGFVTNDRHHGEGQHHQRDLATPAMPRAGLIVIEAELILRRLESILDGSALPFDGNQGLGRGPGGAPGGEVGTLAIAEVAPDHQAACPDACCAIPVLVRVQVSQFKPGPVGKPRPLRALACRQTLPGRGLETLRDRLCSPRDRELTDPGAASTNAAQCAGATALQALADAYLLVASVRRVVES